MLNKNWKIKSLYIFGREAESLNFIFKLILDLTSKDSYTFKSRVIRIQAGKD